jgi:hypothetical protein
VKKFDEGVEKYFECRGQIKNNKEYIEENIELSRDM